MLLWELGRGAGGRAGNCVPPALPRKSQARLGIGLYIRCTLNHGSNRDMLN